MGTIVVLDLMGGVALLLSGLHMVYPVLETAGEMPVAQMAESHPITLTMPGSNRLAH